MQAPDATQHQNLYQIPNCTICLNELTQQLSNLNCGHVFHLTCISQHFQYRGTCPNCQKRAHEKEIRTVVFPLQKNTEAAKLMRQVLGNLSVEEKEQVQVLFREVQTLTERNERLENNVSQTEKQLKKATKELSDTKTSFNRSRVQLQTLKKESLQLKKVIEHLHIQIKNLNEQNFTLRHTIEDYKEKQTQYQQVKKYKRIMYQNSQSLINYKNELQSKGTPAQEMSKRFFDMILIKNLEVIKLKNKLEGHPERLMEKEEEIGRLKGQVERERREGQGEREKRQGEKKKYEELKARYRALVEKYRAKCQAMSDQENYEDSMLSRPSFPLNAGGNGTQNTNKPGNQSNNSTINNNNNTSIDENSSSNIPFAQTKITNKKPPPNIFTSIIEEQGSSNISNIPPSAHRNSQQQLQGQKKPVTQQQQQSSLNGFLVTQKSSGGSGPYGTFGGVGGAGRKKADEKKAVMKNLFS